ncbi:matrilysin-like [Acanthaster planci]|uniref:Matrilysin-like n=1 Tax=Acanthaster planci TaxID=133434 RepID=A0A8B7ZFI3_ACAPL|nr:matrilysin-like [Acanthaster planci]
MDMLWSAFLLVMVAGRARSLAIEPGLSEGAEYLKKYNYIYVDPAKAGTGLDVAAIRSGIRKFQLFNYLNQTGVINAATLDKMAQPRCGCRDPEFAGEAMRDEFRYGREGDKWNKTELTIRIFWTQKGLPKKAVRRVLKQACRLWSSRSPLTFTEVRSGHADINVRFMPTMNHGDRRPFWQPMGEVAHAFPPTDPLLPGDIHLDASEKYTLGDETDGINLFQLLVHLLGHTLGLSHSPHPESVMHPFMRPHDPEFGLSRNDMAGLHALYGRKKRGRSRH